MNDIDLDQLVRDADPARKLQIDIPNPSEIREPSGDHRPLPRRRRSRRPSRLAGGLALVGSGLVVAIVVGTIIVFAGGHQRQQALGPVCTSYRTTGIPINSPCMNLPWQLIEVGPDARSIWIKTAGGCFVNRSGTGSRPTTIVHESGSTIQVRVFSRGRAVIRHGRLNTTCGWSSVVKLATAIDGRQILGGTWPAPDAKGAERAGVLGVPRVIGLAPAQALRVLQTEGFRVRLSGSGRQVVSQLPGWGLSGSGGLAPHGIVSLLAGDRLNIPSTPKLIPGAQTGLLAATMSQSYLRAPEPVALFDAHGRLLARFHATGHQPTKLRLATGQYFLLYDGEARTICPPATARIRAGQVTRTTVPIGCD